MTRIHQKEIHYLLNSRAIRRRFLGLGGTPISGLRLSERRYPSVSPQTRAVRQTPCNQFITATKLSRNQL